MLVLITTIISAFFKVAQLVARVALNRVTVILTFVGTIATTISLIYDSLNDVDGVLNTAVQNLSSVSDTVGSWVAGNDFAQTIGYALSLDVLLDGLVSTFFFVVCSLSGFLLTALFVTFVSILPLLSDLALSAIKHQMAASTSAARI